MNEHVRNRGGFRISDTEALYAVVADALHRIEVMSGPENEADILRRVRTAAFWMTSVVEAAYGSDAEEEALDALAVDLPGFFTRRGDKGNEPA